MIQIGLKNFTTSCIIGCNPDERAVPQEIEVDCLLTLDELPSRDDIAATVNYADVMALIEQAAQRGQFHLLEVLVHTIADGLFERWKQIDRVEITIRKPEALSGRAIPFVQINREREDE